MRTKYLPSQADRAAITRLSWHGFLLCAFAVMTFLAWATLRQALGSELNPTVPHESLPFPDQSHSTSRCGFVNAD
jgi:hypothetical protein